MRSDKRQKKDAAPAVFEEPSVVEEGVSEGGIPEIVTLTEPEEDAGGKRAKGSHARQGQAAYIQKSARMRKILIRVKMAAAMPKMPSITATAM